MRVLVTGSNGLLGTRLLAVLLQRPQVAVLAASRGPCTNRYLGEFPYFPLDITDSAQVARLVAAVAPDVVVHTAALTDVDRCEREPERAWLVNVRATEWVAEACARQGALLVHLSSEYVFDGQAGPYAETDPPRPLSVYGRTKLASEQIVAQRCARWIVARTTVLFGYAPGTRGNFVLWLLDRLARGERTRVVVDQVGSPTLADNLAEMLLALIEGGGQGIYHTVGASRLSRYEFARLAAAVFGLDTQLIEPVTTRELGQVAPRPLRAGLLTRRLEAEFPSVPVLTARAALERLRDQLAAVGQQVALRPTS
ncbi:MAG TPA: dTDP-4-dehydrorhamnose reductase [Chloroflexota bacterium]|nr:dTDP-4-dehydrorhamnose reductase [Chloroflexota bacterium]HZU08075.1 dTDP-4-dehydrorhamnose reductase [Chloroflexota bacterium]